MYDPKERPEKWTDWIRTHVAPKTDEERIDPAIEPLVTETELTVLRRIIEDDYRQLVEVLRLIPVPLDIYAVSRTSDDRTDLGTPVKNNMPLYDMYKIVLPLDPGTVEHERQENTVRTTRTQNELFHHPEFAPDSWEMQSRAWPKWRLDLWHETVHQVEEQIYDSWEGGEIHGPSYMRAIVYTTEKLRPICRPQAIVTPADVRVLMLSDRKM